MRARAMRARAAGLLLLALEAALCGVGLRWGALDPRSAVFGSHEDCVAAGDVGAGGACGLQSTGASGHEVALVTRCEDACCCQAECSCHESCAAWQFITDPDLDDHHFCYLKGSPDLEANPHSAAGVPSRHHSAPMSMLPVQMFLCALGAAGVYAFKVLSSKKPQQPCLQGSISSCMLTCFFVMAAFIVLTLKQNVAAAGGVVVARTFEHMTRSPPSVDSMEGYKLRMQATVLEYRFLREKKSVTLKAGTHRHVWGTPDIRGQRLDLSHYVHILAVDEAGMTVDVEGRAFFIDVLTYLLAQHRMTLEVIPDMVHLTIGGLYAGVGGGAASFRYGAFHHSVVEVDVLAADGRMLTCSATSRQELFAALPGSLGTFGYALRLRLRTKRAGRYVVARHERHGSFQELEEAFLERMAGFGGGDFLDGASYGEHDNVLILGRMVDEKPEGVPLYSLASTGVPYAVLAQKGGEHWFELLDYIYRWDADGYFSTWDTPPWTRDPFLRGWLAALFPWFHRSDWLRELFSLLWGFDLKAKGSHMCVDFIRPLHGVAEHLAWFHKEVGLYPLYLAPMNVTRGLQTRYMLWDPALPAIDVGVGYGAMNGYGHPFKVVQTRKRMERYFGRLPGGARLQYTYTNIHETAEFWSLFPKGAQQKYMDTKAAYDPDAAFPDIKSKLR